MYYNTITAHVNIKQCYSFLYQKVEGRKKNTILNHTTMLTEFSYSSFFLFKKNVHYIILLGIQNIHSTHTYPPVAQA